MIGAVALLCTAPLSAQIFWKSPDFSGLPVAAGEANMGVELPGATPAEQRANLAWQLRAGLNVAALQCQFKPTLLSRDTYNGVLTNHREELAKTYATLAAYFKRTNKLPKAGQQALDRYGTKTYSGVSAVRGILGFCETSSRIGHDALFAPRGTFTTLAAERLRELRNSLGPGYEQQFQRGFAAPRGTVPNFVATCWDKKTGAYRAECGLNPG